MKLKFKNKIFEMSNDISYYKKLDKLKQCDGFISSSEKNNYYEINSTMSNYRKVMHLFNTPGLETYINELIKKKKETDKPRVTKEFIKNKFSFFEKELREFQIDTMKYILDCKYNGFICGNSMGTGKSIVALCLMKLLTNENNIFIICPSPLMQQWKEEIYKWFKEDCIIFEGTKSKREKLYKEFENRTIIKIISYDILKNDYLIYKDQLTKLIKNNYMIIDEATKIRKTITKKDLGKVNKEGKPIKSKVLQKRYQAFNYFSRIMKYKLFLTGTPITKGLEEIYTLIELINKDIIPIINDYIVWETKTFGWGIHTKVINIKTGYKNLDQFVKNIKPIYYRKTLEDVSKELPSKTIKRINIKQTKKHFKLKEEILNYNNNFTGFSLLCSLDSSIDNLKVSQSDTAEILDIPKTYEEPKLKMLCELVENILNNDEKVLIFSRFLESTKIIKKTLLNKFFKKKADKNKITIIDASTLNKDKIKKQFNSLKGKIQVVIATETWAEGVSLENINYLINYDITPDASKYLQRIDRIYRINSTKPKFIYNLVGDIVETHIMDILEKKLLLIEQVTEGKISKFNELDIMNEVLNKLGK